LEDLAAFAELFSALGNPEHEFWRGLPEARSHIVVLGLFGVTQVYPLLFAAWHRLRDDFAGILRMAVVISFRHNVIGRQSTSELEAVYNEAAIQVMSGELRTPAAIFNALQPIYSDDERFKNDFAYAEIKGTPQGKKLLRYVLQQLERDASGRPTDADDIVTIEHILPQNPSEVWDDRFPPGESDGFVWRLGNLTLLEASINRDLERASFEEKLRGYGRSRYEITRGIKAEEWNPDALFARQKQMAVRAAHIWRLDY
jgi:hypothetical protein